MPLEVFIQRWLDSGGAERANKDLFLGELCDVLGVERPRPKTGDPERDSYVFEADAKMARAGADVTIGRGSIDLYRAGRFILEAKQGSEQGAHKLGTARRGTPSWNIAMNDAYGQALGYARCFDQPVPFLVVTDLGHCFDLYAAFDGSWDYRPFPNAQANRIGFRDLDRPVRGLAKDMTGAEVLRRVWDEPLTLDPSKHAAKVTRDVAAYIANLAKKLEADGHGQELVATFLMRCLFTMFAEDVGLLPENTFTSQIRDFWLPSPASFPGGVESLWRTMNEGGHVFGVVGKILQFNGGLFREPRALPLDKIALTHLLHAAECNWADVEPAIFGTLLERALDPKERHRLGAHYTPRAYVERLVRPTIEEPLRADWDVVQAQVRRLVAGADAAKNPKDAKKKENEAVEAVRAFHRKLCSTRVLDPACGSGNFLYVTLEVFKRIEGEVLALLGSLRGEQEHFHLESVRVTPAQFLGIEVKRWAKEIAELVLWIGYLQWHFRMYGKAVQVPEPVLQDYGNIQWRDAVLAYDAEELVRDERGKPVTRWDGETTKPSPVTGEPIPDESARVPIYSYSNPRKAAWPAADFIIGNPPFIGGWRIRQARGDGYVEALWSKYPEIPEKADYVMYWWDRAAEAVRSGGARAFGLITTNSIGQVFQRRVPQRHLGATESPLRIVFAIPDHPWVDDVEGAAVRVAMTVGSTVATHVRLAEVVAERDEEHLDIRVRDVAVINADLTSGVNLDDAHALRSNADLCSPGVQLYGAGFIVERDELAPLIAPVRGDAARIVRPYLNGRDLMARSRDVYVIDFFGLDEQQARACHPAAFQRVLDRVKPERDQNRRASIRDRWWRFGWERPVWRAASVGLRRFIATAETAKHRVFVFLDGLVLPDNMLTNFAIDDASYLGILSSRIHVTWALAAGGTLEDRPRYNKTVCFDPFPFPEPNDIQRARLRSLAEELDAHRKRQQAAHAELTITGMYNVLEKLRSGAPLSAKDKVIHEQGLVSVLNKLHDDLDAAVFDAYGWPADLADEQILERLVALNRERADEERRGVIRWLRPDFQTPDAKKPATQTVMAGADEPAAAAAVTAAAAWPKKLPEQIGAIRDLVTKGSEEWSAEQVAAAFKGGKRKDAEDLLDGLAALGLLVTYELPEGRRWRAARFVR